MLQFIKNLRKFQYYKLLLKILPYGTELTDVPNPVKILARARFGRISKKEPDAGFAGAEIWYIPILYEVITILTSLL